MTRCISMLTLVLTCVFQLGCQCNNSRVHSALSDEVIERRLATKFDGVHSQDEKIEKALELVDTDTGLGVFQEVDGPALHLIIPRRAGCQLLYPIFPDANLLIHFDESNQYSGFERWAIWAHPDSEFKWDTAYMSYTHKGKQMQFDRVDRGGWIVPRLTNPEYKNSDRNSE